MRAYVVAACVAACLIAASPGGLAAQADPNPDSVYVLDPIDVQGRVDDLTGLVSTASVGYAGARDLRVRPLLRAGDMLETVPGMILTQHSGGGKSNQISGSRMDCCWQVSILTRTARVVLALKSCSRHHPRQAKIT